jgi:flagellar motor protein MotB
MWRSKSSEHLAHSLTDLMTSLMVIFILLLLVFINNEAAVNASITDALLAELKRQLPAQGFHPGQIALDPKDRYSIVITVPNDLLTFDLNKHTLRPEGEDFLRTRIPTLAGILCDPNYRNAIESVVVEGHSDATPYRGATLEESQNQNLKLSQDRSMEVVSKSLQFLMEQPGQRACMLEKISASGRGEQDLEETADRSRRVVFKIRVNSRSEELLNRLRNVAR